MNPATRFGHPTGVKTLASASDLELQAGLDGRILVVFDGLCGFCNRSVRWFLRHDSRDRLRFVPSNSPKIAGLLARQGVGPLGPNTILVVLDAAGATERVLERSEAIIAMMRALPQPWPALATLYSWQPRSLRDSGYGVAAKLRYQFAGRLASCPIPTAEERARFI